VPQDARKGGLPATSDNCQCKRIQHSRIGCGISRRLYFLDRCSRQSFVEMQRNAPMAARREQSLDQTAFLIAPAHRGRQPGGFVSMKGLACLSTVTRPKEIALRRVWALIEKDRTRDSFPDHLKVPEVTRWYFEDRYFPLGGKIMRRTGHPLKKGAPDLRSFLP